MASSRIATHLITQFNISKDAARKRISRVRKPVLRLPYKLLPKGEEFFFLPEQRNFESYWSSLVRALRETKSVHGFAIDALLARGGAVPESEFDVISAAPNAMKKQVSTARLLKMLTDAELLERVSDLALGDCIATSPVAFTEVNFAEVQVRRIVENAILDGLREWIKNLGIGSYNLVEIRGEEKKRMVGAFRWDLTAPSYIQPLRRSNGQPGFVVADVFTGSELGVTQIRYFIRKAQLLDATLPSPVMPILVADHYSRDALYEGRSRGVVMATPESLFGIEVAAALQDLTETLRHAITVVASNPQKLSDLCDRLLAIEGTAGNLRGILFELIVARLAHFGSDYLKIGVSAIDPSTGKSSEIDVMRVLTGVKCTCIECKSKVPGGTLTLDDVEKWLSRIPIYRTHLRKNLGMREPKITFEIWTSGTIEPDAVEKLQAEKASRSIGPITWRNGYDVSNLAKCHDERSIRLALDKHFLKHPLIQT